MKFYDVLKKYGLTADGVSVNLRKKIKEYEELKKALEDQRIEAENENRAARKKKLENEIADTEQYLENMDASICKGIERYNKNKPFYEAQGNKLNQARKNGGNNNPPVEEPPANDPPNDPPTEEPPVDEPPVEEPPANNPPAGNPSIEEPPVNDPPSDPSSEEPPIEEPPIEEPPASDPPGEPVKKKSSLGGWLLGTLVVVVAVATGIHIKNNR